ncbi:hypothetical protein [Actinosynnema sp. NPDC020468]|uniref:hypothetical protein n=1 Tax=Actinosynnema sp. NPDC020468 TaxID=3154488 RepID=UPI00341165B9
MSDTELAGRLRAVADDPRLGRPATESVRRLADALAGSEPLAPWSSIDLVGTLGNPGPAAGGESARSRTVQVVQSVLVFVPILVTWLGLALATGAYQEMLATPAGAEAAAGRSFLELWQSGFGGHLATPFTFGLMAVYTLVALVGVVVATFVGAQVVAKADRGEAADRDALAATLVPLLVRAQVAAKAREQNTPARFTAELAKAGDRLGTMLDRAAAAQTGLDGVVDRVGTLMTELSASVVTVRETAAELRSGSTSVKDAVDVAREATAALEHTVTRHVAAGVDRISDATLRAAAQAKALGEGGRQLLLDTARQVESHLDKAMDRHGEVLARVVSTAHDAVEALRGSTELLSGAGGTLSRDLSEAAREGARAIGDTYRVAVAAAATSLGREMVEVGNGLAERIEELRAVTERHENRTRRATDDHARAVIEMSAALRDFQDALRLSLKEDREGQLRAQADLVDRHAALLTEVTQAHTRAVASSTGDHARRLAESADVHARVLGTAVDTRLGSLTEAAQGHTRLLAESLDARMAALTAATEGHARVLAESADARAGGFGEVLDARLRALAEATEEHARVLAGSADARAEVFGATVDTRLRALAEATESHARAFGESVDLRLRALAEATEGHAKVLAESADVCSRVFGESVDARVAALVGSTEGHARALAESADVHGRAVDESVNARLAALAESTEAHARAAAEAIAGVRALVESTDAHARAVVEAADLRADAATAATEARIRVLAESTDVQADALIAATDARIRALAELADTHTRALSDLTTAVDRFGRAAQVARPGGDRPRRRVRRSGGAS